MSCPTCDHTMQCVGDTVHWCPRCGTCIQDAVRLTHIPKLVERCREFYAEVTKHTRPWHHAVLLPEWFRHGIAEIIHKPEDRPAV